MKIREPLEMPAIIYIKKCYHPVYFSKRSICGMKKDEVPVKWIPIYTGWQLLGLRMEETASTYGG